MATAVFVVVVVLVVVDVVIVVVVVVLPSGVPIVWHHAPMLLLLAWHPVKNRSQYLILVYIIFIYLNVFMLMVTG